MMRFTQWGLLQLDRIIGAVLGMALLALVLAGAGQIVLRVLAGIALPWVTEFSVVLMVWATMLTGYVGIRRDSHLSADFLGMSMSERKKAVLRSLASLLSLLFVVTYGWQSLRVIDSMAGIPFTSLPVTQPVLYWSLPAGAVLMALALLDRLWRQGRALLGE